MANAKPSRSGINLTAGKLEANIPKEEKIVVNDAGETVRRTEYESGTIRETQVFKGDHSKAKAAPKPKTEEELRAEIRAELEAELNADVKVDAKVDAKTPAKPAKGKEGK